MRRSNKIVVTELDLARLKKDYGLVLEKQEKQALLEFIAAGCPGLPPSTSLTLLRKVKP